MFRPPRTGRRPRRTCCRRPLSSRSRRGTPVEQSVGLLSDTQPVELATAIAVRRRPVHGQSPVIAPSIAGHSTVNVFTHRAPSYPAARSRRPGHRDVVAGFAGRRHRTPPRSSSSVCNGGATPNRPHSPTPGAPGVRSGPTPFRGYTSAFPSYTRVSDSRTLRIDLQIRSDRRPAPFGSTGVRFLPPVRTRRTRRMRGPETRTRTYCGLGPTADSDVLHTRTYGERPRRRLDRPRSQVLTQSRLPTRSRPRSIEYGRDDTRQQRRRDSGHRDDSRRSGVAPPPPTEVPTSVRTRDSRDRNATSETGKPRAEATGPVLGSTRRSTFVIRRLPPDDSVGPCECGQDRWVRAVCGGGGRKWCARRSELAREATG